KKKIGLKFFQHSWYRIFKPIIPEERVTCRWKQNQRGDVGRKNKFRMISAVEEEEELMLRMLLRDPFNCLISKPPDSLEPVLDQETGVYGNLQRGSICGQRTGSGLKVYSD